MMVVSFLINPVKANGAKLVKFGMVGVIGFLVDAVVLFLVMRFFAADPFSGRVVSIAAALLTTWYLNRRFTFSVKTRASIEEGVGYATIKLAGQVLNFSIYSSLILFSPVLNAPLSALAAASILVMAFNFLMLDRVLYRRMQ